MNGEAIMSFMSLDGANATGVPVSIGTGGLDAAAVVVALNSSHLIGFVATSELVRGTPDHWRETADDVFAGVTGGVTSHAAFSVGVTGAIDDNVTLFVGVTGAAAS